MVLLSFTQGCASASLSCGSGSSFSLSFLSDENLIPWLCFDRLKFLNVDFNADPRETRIRNSGLSQMPSLPKRSRSLRQHLRPWRSMVRTISIMKSSSPSPHSMKASYFASPLPSLPTPKNGKNANF
jgi:hypothetical protein